MQKRRLCIGKVEKPAVLDWQGARSRDSVRPSWGEFIGPRIAPSKNNIKEVTELQTLTRAFDGSYRILKLYQALVLSGLEGAEASALAAQEAEDMRMFADAKRKTCCRVFAQPQHEN
jgi:hypothetical protein